MLHYMYIACLVKPYEDIREETREHSKYLEILVHKSFGFTR
jgi:hypothetical protein